MAVITPLSVLIVEDVLPDAELLIAEIRRAGFEPRWSVVDNRAGLGRELRVGLDVILCDYSLPGLSAPEVLQTVQGQGLDVPVIIVSGSMDEATCVEMLHRGACDYLLKDRLTRIGPAIHQALTRRDLNRQSRIAEQERVAQANILHGLVENATTAIEVQGHDGTSLVTNGLYRRLRQSQRVAPDAEPGAGKSEPGHEEIRIGGEQRSFYSVRFPVMDAEQIVFAVGTIMVDITAQKDIERELRVAQEELRIRAEVLDGANAELRELDRLKTGFVAAVSHELRTPLTSISGYTELLIDEIAHDVAPHVQRMLDVIERNTQRLRGLVEDLLVLAGIDAEEPSPWPGDSSDQPVDLGRLLEETVSALQLAHPDSGVDLHLRAGSPLPVHAKRSDLKRALAHLLSNAIKYSRPGDAVTIDAHGRGHDVVVDIADTGIGIKPEELAHVFDRFFRSADHASHSIPGAGLGLSIARDIIHHCAGRITVRSDPGHGSVFTLVLPRAGAVPTEPTVPAVAGIDR